METSYIEVEFFFWGGGGWGAEFEYYKSVGETTKRGGGIKFLKFNVGKQKGGNTIFDLN